MSELEKLRTEVREALDEIDDCMRMDIKVVPVGALGVLSTELLRLANENADYGKHAIEQYRRGVYWMDRAKEAESELKTFQTQSIYPRAQLLANLAAANERAEKSESELAALKSAACEWRHDLDEDTWDSACGERWMFEDGGPEENSVRFCHGCGKRVRLVVEE